MSYLANSYKSGTWKTVCDRCGCIFLSDQLTKTWDGYMVCKPDWEPRPEQDYIRAGKPEPAVPWTRPEAPDQFVNRTFRTVPENTIPPGSSGTEGGL